MNAMSLYWLSMGGAMLVVVIMALLLWLQWQHVDVQKRELTVLRNLLDNVGSVIRQLELERKELTSGLRAERAHVEQLQRKLSLVQ
ncbi:hypothetical protein [Pseudomonas sp. GM60]|uniref:hypothetical protein n=1 Tax=Pseudomonas sp. GM60 TaxID=1144334 RepID=UPI0002706E7A|nr:hypothetical protein [Pseudomonas sp. GM60]EJM79598.1 hypothetical protein PMI32_04190 [Pseudomonas sp. GM60]